MHFKRGSPYISALSQCLRSLFLRLMFHCDECVVDFSCGYINDSVAGEDHYLHYLLVAQAHIAIGH